HPHVERSIVAERKSASGLVELHRGDANVHDDAVDLRRALRFADMGEVGKPVLEQGQPAGRLIDQGKTARDRRAVAVDADYPGPGDAQAGPAVAARPESGIDIDPALARVEKCNRLAAEHRDVSWIGRVGSRRVHGANSRKLRSRKRKTDAKG